MSRAGEEMVLELASLLNTDIVKSASKDEEEKEGKEHEEKESKEKEKVEQEEKEAKKKKDDAKKKKDKKASVMVHVLRDLVKLAGELDDLGADEASGLVDDALRSITNSITKSAEEFQPPGLGDASPDFEMGSAEGAEMNDLSGLPSGLAELLAPMDDVQLAKLQEEIQKRRQGDAQAGGFDQSI